MRIHAKTMHKMLLKIENFIVSQEGIDISSRSNESMLNGSWKKNGTCHKMLLAPASEVLKVGLRVNTNAHEILC